MATEIKDNVKEYYGKTLQNNRNLKTNACAKQGGASSEVKDALKLCHADVLSRYYGCGSVFPSEVDGVTVLDFGSGAGRDCFVLSKLVGKDGYVTGIDMTEEQLNIAKKYIPYHTEKFGYSKPNVEFKLGYIEDLKAAGIQDNSCDVIVSNCVINLSSDKPAVFREAFRVLKEGGELYFSDMYVDRHIPEELKSHKELWGEGMAGALYWKFFVNLTREIGFSGPYLVSSRMIECYDEDLAKLVGDSKYVAATYRLFKISKKQEEQCGNTLVKYKGTISECPDKFTFDATLTFDSSFQPVSPAVAMVLKQSRYSPHFEFQESAPVSDHRGAPCNSNLELHADPFVLASAGAVAPACQRI